MSIKIIRFSHQPITTVSTDPVPQWLGVLASSVYQNNVLQTLSHCHQLPSVMLYKSSKAKSFTAFGLPLEGPVLLDPNFLGCPNSTCTWLM